MCYAWSCVDAYELEFEIGKVEAKQRKARSTLLREVRGCAGVNMYIRSRYEVWTVVG